jgi:cyanophycinase
VKQGPERDDKRDIPHVDEPTGGREIEPDPRGTLVLIGGACTPHGHALRSFLDLVDARGKGRIVGLTTASAEPEASADQWRAVFRAAGAVDVEIPTFDRTNTRRDQQIARMVADASGVFLGGGDQVKLVASLSGTRTSEAIYDVHRTGGVICGTSAGAAAVTELTMAGGEIDEEGNLVEQYLGPGLGLLGHDAIIDTHFSQRRRLQRLFLVVASNRQLFGIGIDEDTALIVRGHRGEVVGAGGVTFVDGRDTVRFDNATDLERGRQLTLSHLRVGIVGTRYHLNLLARDLDELVSGEPSVHRVENRHPVHASSAGGLRDPRHTRSCDG